jgi:hypothetical protein
VEEMKNDLKETFPKFNPECAGCEERATIIHNVHKVSTKNLGILLQLATLLNSTEVRVSSLERKNAKLQADVTTLTKRITELEVKYDAEKKKDREAVRPVLALYARWKKLIMLVVSAIVGLGVALFTVMQYAMQIPWDKVFKLIKGLSE